MTLMEIEGHDGYLFHADNEDSPGTVLLVDEHGDTILEGRRFSILEDATDLIDAVDAAIQWAENLSR